jgi:nitroreductase
VENISQYDCLLDLVKKRRTIRHFKPYPVPDDYITKIIEVARWAPSAFHTQPWEFVVIKKPEIRGKIIAALERHGPPIKNPAASKQVEAEGSFRDAPVYILLLCDWRARVGLPGRTGENEAAVAGLYASSMADAFMSMHLAAAALGLASQWYTATSRPEAAQAIRNIVGIPESLKIYDMMVLGYPAGPVTPKIIRELEEMVHYDDCGAGDFRSDDEVAAYAEKTKAWCLAEH